MIHFHLPSYQNISYDSSQLCKKEMPAILGYLQKVVAKHGERHPEMAKYLNYCCCEGRDGSAYAKRRTAIIPKDK